jgi:hypothetical protein
MFPKWLFEGWRICLRGRFSSGQRRRQQRSQRRSQRPFFPLRLEPLEDRCLPTAPVIPVPRFHFQYSFTGFTPQTIQPPAGESFHAGDRVVIEANVEEPSGTADTDFSSDFPEQLSLVVSSPGQNNLAISGDAFAAGDIVYQAVIADNTPIYATITAGDGDETAYVNVDDYPAVARIDVNNTADTKDNIVLYNAPSTPGVASYHEAYRQTIPVQITNLGKTTATFGLSVDPNSGDCGSLSRSSVTLRAGGSTDVTFTPTRDSVEPYDVHIMAKHNGTIVAGNDLTVVSVTFNPKIYNSDTPLAMLNKGAYRIPPTALTDVVVNISPTLSDQVVTVAVEGQSVAHGTVSINGAGVNTSADVQYGPVTLSGVQQTRPTFSLAHNSKGSVDNVIEATVPNPNAHQLHLVIRVGGTNKGHDTIRSRGFGVAAIPLNMTETIESSNFHLFKDGDEFIGLVVNMSWESDSGNQNDLGQVALDEVVQDGPATGIFAGTGKSDIGTYFLATGGATDTHYYSVHSLVTKSRLVTSGSLVVFQTHVFADFRMGVVNIPMTNSGFQIVRLVHQVGNQLWLKTSKAGAAVTANRIFSEAGTVVESPAQADQPIPGITIPLP